MSNGTLLLVALGGEDRLARPEQSSAALDGRHYRAIDGEPGYIYLYEGDAGGVRETAAGVLKHGQAALYEPLFDLPGNTRPGGEQRVLLIVGLDLDSGHEDEFDDWYNTEHLPNLAQVPGVIRARRFRRSDEGATEQSDLPEYLALYDLESPEVFGSDDWVAAVETEWTQRLRQVFHGRIRTVYREES